MACVVDHDLYGQCPPLTARRHVENGAFRLVCDQLGEFWRNLAQVRAGNRISFDLQHGFCTAIGNADSTVCSHCNHTRSHARKHSLNECAAAVEQMVRVDKLAPLLFDPPGHLIEGIRQSTEFIPRLRHFYTRRKVAGGNFPGCVNEVAYRFYNAVRDAKRNCYRRPYNDERDEE